MLPFVNFLPLYRLASKGIAPFLPLLLNYRVMKGKELKERCQERKGISALERPEGKLVWVHAASNGEVLSVRPLMLKMMDSQPDLRFILTTTTLSAQERVQKLFPKSVIHQFAPYDVPKWTMRFFDHWHPDMALMVEQEIWPNLISLCATGEIPLILVNGRISNKSLYRWRTFRTTAARLFDKFTMAFAMDEEQKRRLHRLGIQKVHYHGDLKAMTQRLVTDEASLISLKQKIGNRPLWLAACTHEGEEAMAVKIAQALMKKTPDLLTVIAPRKLHRLSEITQLLKSNQIKYSVRIDDEWPEIEDQILVVNKYDELGLYYSIAQFCFVGGSLFQGVGGHNPMEAAAFHCPIIMGRDQENCLKNAQLLKDAGGMVEIKNAEDGAVMADQLFHDPKRLKAMRQAQIKVLEGLPDTARTIANALLPLIGNSPSKS